MLIPLGVTEKIRPLPQRQSLTAVLRMPRLTDFNRESVAESNRGLSMRVLVLSGDNPDLETIESAFLLGEIDILGKPGLAGWPGRRGGRWRFEGWMLDIATRQCVGPAGRHVELTSSEFDLLTAFLRRPGQTLSRNALLRDLRGRAWTYLDRTIDTLVARLRKKIDLDPARPLIRSVRGVGYVFCATVSGAAIGEQ